MLQLRNIILLSLLALGSVQSFAQEANPVLIGAGHAMFIPDARARALAGAGAATKPDAYSVYWNPAKFGFIESDMGFGLSYEAQYAHLDVEGAFYSNNSFFTRLQNQNVVGVNFSYYKIGQSQVIGDDPTVVLGEIAPYEMSGKVSYTARYSEKLSFGGDVNYFLVDYGVNSLTETAIAGGVSMYYQTIIKDGLNEYDFAFGAYISNIGPKIGDRFLPTNLRLGASLGIPVAFDHKVTASLDINKLLVPTPQFDLVVERDTTGAKTGVEYKRFNPKYENAGPFGSILASLNDAPGGFSEELQEINFSFGLEYGFKEQYFARLGYFNEHKLKGQRNHFAMGLGAKFAIFHADLSYMLSTADYQALGNQLMFTFRMDIDQKAIQRMFRGDFEFNQKGQRRRRTRRTYR